MRENKHLLKLVIHLMMTRLETEPNPAFTLMGVCSSLCNENALKLNFSPQGINKLACRQQFCSYSLRCFSGKFPRATSLGLTSLSAANERKINLLTKIIVKIIKVKHILLKLIGILIWNLTFVLVVNYGLRKNISNYNLCDDD